MFNQNNKSSTWFTGNPVDEEGKTGSTYNIWNNINIDSRPLSPAKNFKLQD